MKTQIIDLPKIEDPRGNLTFIEGNSHIPFEIQRVYWIYDVPGGKIRGGHAFKEQQEFIVALSGSFDVVVNIAQENKIFHLNLSYYACISNKFCSGMENFLSNSVVMILRSTKF